MLSSILLTLLLLSSSLTTPTAEAIKRLDVDDFHHLGNFLRSMQKFTEIDHLYKPFQQYIVQRTVRGAKDEIPEDDNEERIFFSIFTDYGQTNNLGADWTVDDISEVKARCTSLVKLMNRRRRLEEEVDADGNAMLESGL